jgi:leucyl-tRNA synthetase
MAISEMMVYMNECYRNDVHCRDHLNGFLSVLSCFAPFLADELNATVMQNKICVIHST